MSEDRRAGGEGRAQWVIDKTWRFHRSVALAKLEVVDSGVWAQIRGGAGVTTHDRSMSTFDHDAVVFFPNDRWWSAMFLVGAPVDIHVDISTPARVEGSTVTTIDLDLDVVVRQGTVSLVDVDEFDEHRILHSYDAAQIREAERAAHDVRSMIAAGEFPFDGSHRARLEELRD